jgi:hypothetical protein
MKEGDVTFQTFECRTPYETLRVEYRHFECLAKDCDAQIDSFT